jgi:hypothetical protein
LPVMENLKVLEYRVRQLKARVPAFTVEQFDLHPRPERLHLAVVAALSGQSRAAERRSVGAASWCLFESPEAFFLVSGSIGDRAECGAEVVDLGGDAAERAGIVTAVAVFFYDGTQFGVAQTRYRQ